MNSRPAEVPHGHCRGRISSPHGPGASASRHLTDPARPLTRAERRRLTRCDAVSARLAELHAIRDLLSDATEVLGHGWVQNAWFAVATPRGARLLTAHEVRQVYEYQVTGACLAGSIVLAAGGPNQARTQPVQRTLDLAWHALRDDPVPPAVLCPSPPVRTMRLLDLTRWNDAPGRTRAEALNLLRTAGHLADLHEDTCRRNRAETLVV
jgi:hypothetical protein